jgi:aerobic carbon-monoxide dehydrogenase medium subunit
VLGLGATVQSSQRAIAADDFFTGLFETALKRGEIITRVAFPVPRRSTKTALCPAIGSR